VAFASAFGSDFDLVSCLRNTGKGTYRALVARRNAYSNENIYDFQRLTLVDLLLNNGKQMGLGVYHGVSRLDEDNDGNRLSAAKDIAVEARRWVADRENIPTIIGGDFNAEPWSQEIAGEAWYAGWEPERLAIHYFGKASRTPVLTFFNPMWRVILQSGVQAAGTFHYEANRKEVRARYFFDGFLTTPDLREGVNCMVLDHLLPDVNLLVPGLNVPDINLSDHLPVQIEVSLP